MIKPETLKALRVIALQNADDKTYDAWYKSICRWYSEKFHTPLATVMDLADEEVLLVYYEDLFWSLKTGSEKQKEAFEHMVEDVLIEEHEGSRADVDEAQVEDDEWYEQELAEFEEKTTKQDAKFPKETVISNRDGSLLNEPNLDIEPVTRFVEGEDDPPDDDDEGLL